MVHAVNVVVSCTKSKARVPERALALGGISGKRSRRGAAEWLRRLRRPSNHEIKAINLYRGGHWAVLRSIVEGDDPVPGVKISAWACSAGNGVLSRDARKRP